MSRIVWDDLWGEARHGRWPGCWRSTRVTLQRFGFALPDGLDRFARRCAAGVAPADLAELPKGC